MKILIYISLMLTFCVSTPLSIFAQEGIKRAIRNAKSSDDRDEKGNLIVKKNQWGGLTQDNRLNNFGMTMIGLMDEKTLGASNPWLFDETTKLVEMPNNTAQIKGRIVQFGYPNHSFEVEINLSGRRDDTKGGELVYGFVQNTKSEGWHFYDGISGKLTGDSSINPNNELKGSEVEINMDDSDFKTRLNRNTFFQIGQGANQIAEDKLEFGCAGWFSWKVTNDKSNMLRSSSDINNLYRLDRGSVHFITTPECVTNPISDSISFRVSNARDTSTKCTNGVTDTTTFSGFFGDNFVLTNQTEFERQRCRDTIKNNTLRIADDNIAFLKFTGSPRPPVMTGCVDIKNLTMKTNDKTFTFNLRGERDATTPFPSDSTFSLFGQVLNTPLRFNLTGTVTIDDNGNSSTQTITNNSFLYFGSFAKGINKDSNGIVGFLKFDYLGRTKVIKWNFVLDTVPFCENLAPAAFATRPFQLAFTASADNSNARLEWVNNTGDKNDYFVVQKADENGDFKDIDFINGEFKASTKYFSTYDYHTTEGENLYRLKLVLFNGAYKYSDIQTVKFDAIKDVRLSPNPADDNLHIDLKNYNDAPVSVFMYDVFGKAVLSKINTSNHANTIDLDTSSLKTGQYIVRVIAKNKRDILKKIMIVR